MFELFGQETSGEEAQGHNCPSRPARVEGQWGTVPHHLAVTEQVPDIEIVDKTVQPNRVVLSELTVPWDSARQIEAARKRKVERYERLELDIKEKGLIVDNCPLEVGARGVITELWGAGYDLQHVQDKRFQEGTEHFGQHCTARLTQSLGQ